MIEWYQSLGYDYWKLWYKWLGYDRIISELKFKITEIMKWYQNFMYDQ